MTYLVLVPELFVSSGTFTSLNEAPHFVQNFAVSLFSNPQLSHFIISTKNGYNIIFLHKLYINLIVKS